MEKTFFAPAERISGIELQNQMEFVSKNPVMTGMLNIVSGLLAVLNEHRQILALNDHLLEKMGIDDPMAILGLRPGEALHCAFAEDGPGGCGTGKLCASCGAAIAIVISLATNKPAERLCALRSKQDGKIVDLYFIVRAQPLLIEDQRMVLLFLQDITLQHHWETMERVFFHDITNTITGLVGSSEMLLKECPPELQARMKTVHELAMQLSKDIQMQKYLVHPDMASRDPQLVRASLQDIIIKIQRLFSDHPLLEGKTLTITPQLPETELWTDPYILIRVLVNMITNALEASQPGEEVRVSAEVQAHQVVFSVWNQQHIPDFIAGRIFQRNFTTKPENGHGLGTYSMKLFGETLLEGDVGFLTSETDGTIFYIKLPL